MNVGGELDRRASLLLRKCDLVLGGGGATRGDDVDAADAAAWRALPG